MNVTKEEAEKQFRAVTGMSEEKMRQAGIEMEECPCGGGGLCNGWLAVYTNRRTQ